MEVIRMRAIEILEAERLVEKVLNRNFIDDFCCGEDFGLNLDLTIENLTSGYYNALRKLELNFDDDKISEEQYTKTKNALTSLYNYYRQTIVNSVNKINVSNNDDVIRGEEFIDLPDFVDLGSPEEHIYIEMYKKYGIDNVSQEEQEFFRHQFYEQFFGNKDRVEEYEKIEGNRSTHHF